MKKSILLFIPIIILTALVSCNRSEVVVTPEITDFDTDRYLGTWYQIARIDNRFEKGQHYISTRYTKREDGCIDVSKRGYNVLSNSWQFSNSYAVRGENPSAMKVYSKPLIGMDHKVAYVDPEYSVAIVTCTSPSFVWVLSRTASLTDEKRDELISIAEDMGYEGSEFEFVIQKESEMANFSRKNLQGNK